jgi:hypothetical protein
LIVASGGSGCGLSATSSILASGGSGCGFNETSLISAFGGSGCGLSATRSTLGCNIWSPFPGWFGASLTAGARQNRCLLHPVLRLGIRETTEAVLRPIELGGTLFLEQDVCPPAPTSGSLETVGSP